MIEVKPLILLLLVLSLSVLVNVCRLLAWDTSSLNEELVQTNALALPSVHNTINRKNNNNNAREQESEATPPLFPPQEQRPPQHRVAGLSCPPYQPRQNNNNDSNNDDKWNRMAYDDIVYWRDLPQDSHQISPYKKEARTTQQQQPQQRNTKKKKKYLTFEPDEGGWNNIRMAMETAVVMAVAMGRTLVLPPNSNMYLLWEQPHNTLRKNQAAGTGFDDFFHLQSLTHELEGLEIISFQDFLERHVMTGQVLGTSEGGKAPLLLPPGNRTNWNGLFQNWESAKLGSGKELWEWWRNVTTPLHWRYQQCVVAFPTPSHNNNNNSNNNDDEWISTTPADHDRVQAYLQQILQHDDPALKQRRNSSQLPAWLLRVESYSGHPTPVNATPTERLRELLADRRELCIYDTTLQDAEVLHASGEQSSTRFLVHFYALLFMEDWRYDLWLKRFVRDHLRYRDEIQCAATRIVAALRQAAYDPVTNPTGSFDTMHIRRGDFQYAKIKISAADLYENNTRHMIPEGRTVFIATDEKQKLFFAPLAQHYRLYFLSDFMQNNNPLLVGVNPNYYGMIDQVVASAGQVFVGTYYSTFTSYINRLRGYHAQRRRDYGHEHGVINSYYYAGEDGFMAHVRTLMRSYNAVRQGFWEREFAIGWRDIDHQ